MTNDLPSLLWILAGAAFVTATGLALRRVAGALRAGRRLGPEPNPREQAGLMPRFGASPELAAEALRSFGNFREVEALGLIEQRIDLWRQPVEYTGSIFESDESLESGGRRQLMLTRTISANHLFSISHEGFGAPTCRRLAELLEKNDAAFGARAMRSQQARRLDTTGSPWSRLRRWFREFALPFSLVEACGKLEERKEQGRTLEAFVGRQDAELLFILESSQFSRANGYESTWFSFGSVGRDRLRRALTNF